MALNEKQLLEKIDSRFVVGAYRDDSGCKENIFSRLLFEQVAD